MLPKMSHLNVLLESVPCKVANILKQEMLSLGGDAAVARGTVGCTIPETDVLVMGTRKQLNRLVEKLTMQPFGLRDLAQAIIQLLDNMDQDTFVLKTPRRNMPLGSRTFIMGILNVTPDSFSDGGRFYAADKAVEHGLRMAEDGADIIDVGGESSRPGADPVSAEEELARVLPVIEKLAGLVEIPLSVDTTKAAVAQAAVAAGAEIVNDISAMTLDTRMAGTIAESGAAVVLMHMRGLPKDMQTGDLTYRDLIADVMAYLRARLEEAKAAGIAPERIVVDPGIGFGKTAEDNLKILKHLDRFRALGRPVMTGVSRKSFIGRLTGDDTGERLEGTAAAVAAAILNGSAIIRVHDVKAMKKVAALCDAICGSR